MSNLILCVDDEIDIRDVLMGIVSDMGYNIECAEGESEAIEMFTALKPFLVLMDLRLRNNENGTLIANKLHAVDPLCIFIAVSGYLRDLTSVGYLLGSVFTDMTGKPFDKAELRRIIDYGWEKRQRWNQIVGVL